MGDSTGLPPDPSGPSSPETLGLLQHVMPYQYTPVALIAIGGILFALGAWLGPETAGGGTLARDTVPAGTVREGTA